MKDYASIKGRSSAPAVTPPPRRPAAPVSDAEKARIEANRQFVLEHMPELVPLIRELYAEGLIDGWRAVKNCKLNERTS